MTRKRMMLLTGGASLALLLLLIGAAIDAAPAREKNHDSQSPPNVSQLIQQLNSRDLHRRIKAANALAAMKPFPPEAIPALIQVLKNPDPMRIVSRFAVNALSKAGAPAIPALSQLLQDQSPGSAETRLAAVYALGGMAKQEPAVWPILIGRRR
jgi:HEAT repeat protein